MKFDYVELFGGILGFGTALDRVGGSPVLISEIDKHAQEAIKALGRGDILRGDVTKIEAASVPNHTILAAGYPCQAFSTSGRRRGYEDARGTLFFEVIRIAKEKRPEMLLLENVKGLVHHDKGNTITVMFHALNEIGYKVDFRILTSLNYGVPQKRERVYIVAVRDDLAPHEAWTGQEGKTMVPKMRRKLSGEGLQTFNFDWPAPQPTPPLSSILEENPAANLYVPLDKINDLIVKLRPRELAQIENAPSNAVLPFIAPDRINKTINGSRIGEHEAGANTLTTMDRHGVLEGIAVREATKRGYAIAEPGDVVNYSFPRSVTRRGRVGKGYANTLEASQCDQGIVMKALNEDYYTIRKFSTLEAFRLQGFPDSHHQTIVDAGISTAQRYKQAGNAVSVPVVEAVARQMVKFLSELRGKNRDELKDVA